MKTIYINYKTLKDYFFASSFKEPVQTEVYYTADDNGWDLEFSKNNYYLHCRVTKEDLFSELPLEHKQEDRIGKINAFEVAYLRKAIKVDRIGEESKDETPEQRNPIIPDYQEPFENEEPKQDVAVVDVI